MPKVPGIVPVKYSTAITTANKVRRIRSVDPMFGFIGAVLGHLLWGIPLTLESYVGLFAVGGIVINDSLILVAKINEAVQKDVPLIDAVLSAGKARFRAIFLTTATTFIGLLPLLFEQSSHAEKILPMAVTLAFGVLFATLVTLLLVPISSMILM